MIAYSAVVLFICVFVPQLLVESPIRRILFGIGMIGICVFGLRATKLKSFRASRLIWYTLGQLCMIGLVYQGTLEHVGVVFLHMLIIIYSYVASQWKREWLGVVLIVPSYLFMHIVVAPHEAGYVGYWLFFDSLALSIDCGIGAYLGKKDREMANLVRQLQSANELLRKRSLIDPLTGLLQKDIFRQEVEERLRALGPDDRGYLFFFDIDDFKRVNDTYGHPFGDLVLQGVSSVLLEEASERNQAAPGQAIGHAHGIAGRFGGEEMVLFICHIDEPSARQVAEKMRVRISQLRFATEDGHIVAITTSIGAAGAGTDGDYLALVEGADQAMYTVKRNGKNGHRFESDTKAHTDQELHMMT
jgi:diguanylate cyclase (GGDEF)-like protein